MNIQIESFPNITAENPHELYVVGWRSFRTAETGRGTSRLPKEHCEEVCRKLNNSDDARSKLIQHYPVRVQ